MIEAFLAAFLSFAPPATTVTHQCDDYSSIKPGCNRSSGGGRPSGGETGGKGKDKK